MSFVSNDIFYINGEKHMLRYVEVLRFFIPGVPRARQSMRVAAVTDKNDRPVYNNHIGKDGKLKHSIKIAKFQSKETTNDFAYLKYSMVAARNENHKFKPWSGPVIVRELVYVFPPLKANTDKNILLKATKPDLVDNLNKAVFDAMKGVLVLDDAQIVGLLSSFKIFGDTPGIHIDMIELES